MARVKVKEPEFRLTWELKRHVNTAGLRCYDSLVDLLRFEV